MKLTRTYILSVLIFGILHIILLVSTDDLYPYSTHYFLEDVSANYKLNRSVSAFGDSICFSSLTKIRPIDQMYFNDKFDFTPTEMDSIHFWIDDYEIFGECYSDGSRIYLLLSDYRLSDGSWSHFVNEYNWNDYLYLTEQIRSRILGEFERVRDEKWDGLIRIYGHFFLRNIFSYILIILILFMLLHVVEPLLRIENEK